MFEVGRRRRWSIARVEPGGTSRHFPLSTLEYLVEVALDMAEVEAWKGRLIDGLYTLG